MDNVRNVEQERTVLRWGGLAGMLGSLIFILVFVVVGVFVGVDPGESGEWIVRFPEIRAARTVENGLYLLVLILWVPHFLALYRALRGAHLAPALFGSVLGIAGLTVVATGALPHVAQLALSNAYHAPGATAADRTALILVWHGVQGIFDALLYTGLLFLPLGLILLGVAMLRDPAFGKILSGMSVLLGVLGVVTATYQLIDPFSASSAIGVFALIIFHFIVGWKVYTLSRAV
jgi:hypothetical protein